jgi:putative zinc finger protein
MTRGTAACKSMEHRALVERYVAGTLSEPEASELEIHFLTCAHCQEEVRLAATIGAAPAVHPGSRRSSTFRIGVGLAVAASLGVLLLAGPRRSAQVTPLGEVAAAPLYLGIPVRGDAAAGDSVFDLAMRTYASGHYDSAVAGLDRALRAGSAPAPAEFFRAAALLMARHDAEAAAGFRRVITMGETQYLPESRYYLAKALIRMGHTDEALDVLRRGVAPKLHAAPAAALAESLKAAIR